jgi:sporulation protein YlmC with PRC-barrel domain
MSLLPDPQAPSTLDVALRLLDHQITGPDGQLLGNVDDLELVERDERLLITGLMVGPAALGGRLPGKLGDWTVAIWRRLHPEQDPKPIVVPLHHVARIRSAVELDNGAASALLGASGLERWLRHYVVARIPGATGGGDKDTPPALHPPSREDAERLLAPRSDGRPASDLIGARVLGPQNSDLGIVCELRCSGITPRAATAEITHLQHTSHGLGSRLGYERDARQGPAAVGAVARWWHRHDRLVPLSDVIDIDWEAHTVRIRGAQGDHPLAGS